MIANLLGVAGTDVPIEEIQKLMIPHMVSNIMSFVYFLHFILQKQQIIFYH